MGCTDSKPEKKPQELPKEEKQQQQPEKKSPTTTKSEPISQQQQKKTNPLESNPQQNDSLKTTPPSSAAAAISKPKSPRPKLFGFFPGAGGCIDLLRAATTTNLGSDDYSRRLDESFNESKSPLMPSALTSDHDTLADIEKMTPSVAATYSSILSDLKLIENHRGENARSVTDHQLRQMIADATPDVLKQVVLIDISYCDKLSIEACQELFRACANENLRAIYAFPIPKNKKDLFISTAAGGKFTLPPSLSIFYTFSDDVELNRHLFSVCEEVTNRNKSCALNWTSLGSCLATEAQDAQQHQHEDNDTEEREALIGGKKYNAQQCLLEAIRHKDSFLIANCRRAWYELGVLLAASESNGQQTVQFEGKFYTSRDCFVQSILCDPEISYSWQGLGTDLLYNHGQTNASAMVASMILSTNSSSTVLNHSPDSRRGSTSMMSNSNIQSSNSAAGFAEDGALVGQQQPTVQVFEDKPPFSPKDCFVMALKCNSENAIAWASLGRTLATSLSTDTVEVRGKPYTKIQCLVRALEIDFDLSSAVWNNLGVAISKCPDVSSVQIKNNNNKNGNNGNNTTTTTFTDRDCFIRAIKLAPEGKYATAWLNVALGLPKRNQQEASMMKAHNILPLQPDQEEVLSSLLPPAAENENDTEKVTRLNCALKSLEINDQLKPAWKIVADFIAPDDATLTSVTVNEKTYNKIDVLRQALV